MNKMNTEMVDMEVVSTESIKPSNPTPPNLRCYQLSLLDQIAPRQYMSPVFFYIAPDNIHDEEAMNLGIAAVSGRLKASLSEVLARYYPLAGRLKGNLIVDCNDEGVPYVEAKVSCALSDVLNNIDPEKDSMLKKFVPFVIDDHGSTLLGVQFNMFECGGFALGLCLSHKVADGASLFVFMNIWAKICRGEGLGGENVAAFPEFIGYKLFPPKDSYNNLSMGVYPSTVFENVIAKRFVFGSHAVEALRKKAGTDLAFNQRQPSRVEAVEALILKRFAASTDRGGAFVMHQAVDLRRIVDPPLPEHAFGNMVGRALAYLPRDRTSTTGGLCNDLIPRLREAMRSALSKESVEKNPIHLLHLMGQSSKGDLIPFGFSSVCGFRLYGYDFCWGKPALMDSSTIPIRNSAALRDTKSLDGGVEALIVLDKEDMLKFEKDEEIQFYVRFNDKICRL